MFKKDMPCSNGCGRLVGPHGGNGLCASCNQARRREEFRASGRFVPCAVSGCLKPLKAPGTTYCEMHRSRLQRNGEVGPPQSIRRAYGTGGLSSTGYVVIQRGGRRIPEHHWVVEESLGRKLHPFENVHHKNGVRHDNRLDNLEIWIVPQPKGQRPEDLLAWCHEHMVELQETAAWNAA